MIQIQKINNKKLNIRILFLQNFIAKVFLLMIFQMNLTGKINNPIIIIITAIIFKLTIIIFILKKIKKIKMMI